MRTFLRGMASRLRQLTTRSPAATAPAPTVPAKASKSRQPFPPAPATRPPSAPVTPRPPTAPPVKHLPGPPKGRHLAYSPKLDGQADPGEIVWFWVPFEDDPARGKDRPVLVVGRDRDLLLGLMLSSKESRDGQRNWLPLGAGGWDYDARPSWVRLDRVLTVPESGIRREGAVLDRERFDAIAAKLRGSYGWA